MLRRLPGLLDKAVKQHHAPALCRKVPFLVLMVNRRRPLSPLHVPTLLLWIKRRPFIEKRAVKV
jgi:hypothetical protein